VNSMEEKTISLGEKINLSGFQDEESSTMVIIKKMVGNYVKKIAEGVDNFQDISVRLKKIHQHEGKGGKSEVHVKLNTGKVYTSEVVDFNLFVALDKAFKKVMAEC
jgi:ribosome-associated translation inhibitor RaiA